MFALTMAEDRVSKRERYFEIIEGLATLPGGYIVRVNCYFYSDFFILIEKIKQVLQLDSDIKKLSKVLYEKKSLLVMGRGFNFATCLEGALVSLAWTC